MTDNHVRAKLTEDISNAIHGRLVAEHKDTLKGEVNRLFDKPAVQSGLAKSINDALKEAENQLAGQPNQELEYKTVYDFVTGFICQMYPIPAVGSDAKWAETWYLYPHAVARLKGLWLRYEMLKQKDECFLETFFRQYADHHISKLQVPGGVFAESAVSDVESKPMPTKRLSEAELEKLQVQAQENDFEFMRKQVF